MACASDGLWSGSGLGHGFRFLAVDPASIIDFPNFDVGGALDEDDAEIADPKPRTWTPYEVLHIAGASLGVPSQLGCDRRLNLLRELSELAARGEGPKHLLHEEGISNRDRCGKETIT